MDGFAGILLVGGRSSRMGSPKALLDWDGRPLVAYLAELLQGTLAGPVVVVRAPGQALPRLPEGVEAVEDARPGRGPLEGLAAGLRATAGQAEAAYVSATDVPLLRPALVRLVAASLRGHDAAVPRAGGRVYPLSAAYRTAVLATVERHLAAERPRALDLLSALDVRWLDEPELRSADPGLESLVNVNTRADYEAALAAFRAPARSSRSGYV